MDSQSTETVEEKKNGSSSAKRQKVSKDAKEKRQDKSEKKSKGKKASSKEENKEEAAGRRRKIPCPSLACKAQVVHLPRHMRNVHKWTKEAASKVLLKYNIRQRKSKDDDDDNTEQSKKDYHRRRRCPVPGCHTIVFRLATHVQKVHKFERSSKEYKDALACATIVPDRKHHLLQYKERKTHLLIGQSFGEEGTTSSSITSDDDEDDSDDAQEVSGAAEKPAPHPVLTKFEEWLESLDGGKRDKKTVKQHSSQLWKILMVIDDSGDISSLLDINLVRHLFLTKHVEEKKYKAGTIKSYLMSLRHYFSFLLSDRPAEVEFCTEDIRAVRDKISMWSTSYKKESCNRRWQKLEEDAKKRLTPANIQTFEKSEAACEAVKILGQHSDPTQSATMTQTTFILVRDFLFTQIFIDNANRPGVLSHMTMEEFKNVRKDGDNYVISVMKHKTAHVHGLAYIILNSKLKAWLSIFVKVMRTQVATSTTGPVFLSWNGQRMTSSQINKAVKSIFKKAEVPLEVTSTSFRKAAVTNMHESNPEMSSKLANLMAHNESTAKKYYMIAEKTKASLEASKKLSQVMRNQYASGDESKAVSSESDRDAKELPEEKTRVPWTADELLKIENSFRNELKSGVITLEVIRDKVKESNELLGMSPRRIYDKLKKQLKQKKYDVPDVRLELPKACESLDDKLERMSTGTSKQPTESVMDEQSSLGIVSPTEKSSGIFSEWDIETINSMFADMIANKPISKVEVKNRCSACQEGERLLNHLTVNQLVNRIKYARRKSREDAK